jgi:hypothetical protein
MFHKYVFFLCVLKTKYSIYSLISLNNLFITQKLARREEDEPMIEIPHLPGVIDLTLEYWSAISNTST